MPHIRYEHDNLADLITKLNEIIDIDTYTMSLNPGATTEEIDIFEKRNNFTFPKDFREWLKYTDGCKLFDNSIHFYGILHQPYVDTNPKGISYNYIEIGYAFGDPICILNGSQKIYQYGETVIEHENFKTFFALVIKNRVR
ncbi:MAG: SMI1/KNR4 family protein [Candidatus Cloacimonetes bacterium]|nr:SMI1/KNR4 family protein [Candidatus Cloacimonadota bacterium]